MRRQLRLFNVVLLVFGSLSAAACSTPATPTIECKEDANCNSGETCKKGRCLAPTDFLCEAASDCVDALADKSWDPAETTGTTVPACYEAKCVEDICQLAPLAAKTSCADDDAYDCTLGACDGAGKCTTAATMAPNTCLLGETDKAKCFDKDVVNPDNACELCVPDISTTKWTGMPKGASCDDKDGLNCTIGRCDGAGKCDACKDGKCEGQAEISAVACLIGGACIKAGDKKSDSNGCQSCQPSTNQTAWSEVKEGTACEKDGEACRPGACKSGTCEFSTVSEGFCYIPGTKDGACIKDGALESGNSCKTCDAGNAPTKWTTKKLGAACDNEDGIGCTLDQCNSAGNCVGTPKDSLCKASGPCTQGKCDTTAKTCTSVNLPKTATCSGDDGIGCTVEHCDGSGKCDNVATTDKDACDDQIKCTLDACDPKADKGTDGCKHTPDAKACADGNVCTTNTCDVAKGCVPTNNAAACNTDKLSCTQQNCVAGKCVAKIDPGTCNIGGVCSKSGDKSENGCTSCQPKISAEKWSPLQKGVVCKTDGKACTIDQCDGKGQCTHDALVAETCLIKDVCETKGKKTSGGCLVCAPSQSKTAWSPVAKGTGCDVDKFTCTSDTCDGKGICAHAPQHTKCDDKLGCTRDACAPTSAFANGATGCENVDHCPYGHSCDKTAKACLTPKPVVLVTESATDPAPTNPAVLRHVLDPKKGTTRTWVVYQSDSCATVSGGKWQITKPAAMRAVLLDSVEESKPGAGKPKPKVVTFASALKGKNVCQGFPAVSADPNSSSQGWLTWLEADVKAGTCLVNKYQGGIPRLARLDGSAPKGAAPWAAAGAVCPASAGQKPSFVTPGFTALAGAESDPSKRGGIWVRPSGFGLSEVGANQSLMSGPVTKSLWSKGVPQIAEFSTTRSVVIDMGKTDKTGARYWALAMDEEKSGNSYNRAIWAQAFDSSGAKKSKSAWLSSSTGNGKVVLSGVTEVCSVDAAYDAKSGKTGIVVVTRKSGKDYVWLLIRDAAGIVSPQQVVNKNSKGDCRTGFASARVVAGDGAWFVATYESPFASQPTYGSILIHRTTLTDSKQVSTLDSAGLRTTDSVAGSGPSSSLAWRGLADLWYSADGVLSVAAEIDGAGKRAIAIHAFKPK
ncbi:MAG: hypothetical protein KC502_22185 [Myxococcales bacterium]|nr:hypothetical protein [Myxococcales bacterium]